MKAQAYAARVAKRGRKQPRIRALKDDDVLPSGKISLFLSGKFIGLAFYGSASFHWNYIHMCYWNGGQLPLWFLIA